ncbi:class I SAM-dependent methyltransferase [Synoicihabitans lomoniglobus]|uniref:Class I SAM-dependent methyltransferase n=1 Tax=Synoicihabitans lomoniglobus TaxID=2909285 RepID=A0AAF0A124_9BACT|nr:class I SAM-dependent methyltransferase [Opitutaceae bacterium LMO-M01]WED64687.1 class I SAM-dependent methyltransferase [Opitutaceae bacterium LMO-M01]
MHKEEITELFDQHASSYDQKWRSTAPLNAALHLLTRAVLAQLPAAARILCVGAGTGEEILSLAPVYPDWHFTAVEPSAAMLGVFKDKAAVAGVASRCVFHSGYLESLPPSAPFDAATAFLVSQFITERKQRIEFFQRMADRLVPDGVLVSADLAGDLGKPEDRSLLEVWFRVTNAEGPSPEGIKRMREAYSRDVAVLPSGDVQEIIRRGGFNTPVPFYQAGLIHAWYAKRSPT